MAEVYVQRTEYPAAPSLARRVSWGAVFAGLFVTIVVQLMLTLLGVSLGAATIEPLRQQSPDKGLALGSGIWLLVTGLISIWVGAFVAGRMAGGPLRTDGMLHGIVTWSVSTCATMFLLATAVGALLGGTGALLSGALAVGGSTTGSDQGGQMASLKNDVKNLFPQAGSLLPPTGRTESPQTSGQQTSGTSDQQASSSQTQSPGQLTELARNDAELAAAVAAMEKNSGASKSPGDREQVLNILAAKHQMNESQAAALVDQWDEQFQQLKGRVEQKAREVGDTAARGVSQGALWASIALLLGLLVAAWGGWVGTASLPFTEPERVAAP